jgi:hypothetical protein
LPLVFAAHVRCNQVPITRAMCLDQAPQECVLVGREFRVRPEYPLLGAFLR